MLLGIPAIYLYVKYVYNFFREKELYLIFDNYFLSLLVVPLLSIPALIIHELFHGIMAFKVKANIWELGFIIYYLYLGFYVDVTDIWTKDRKTRILVTLAGPYSTFMIWILLVYIVYIDNYLFNFLNYILEKIIILTLYSLSLTLIWSLYPFLLRTDGYYIIQDLLKIDNLNKEILNFIKKFIYSIINKKFDRILNYKTIFYIFYLIISLITLYGFLRTVSLWFINVFNEFMVSIKMLVNGSITITLIAYFFMYILLGIRLYALFKLLYNVKTILKN